MTPRDRLVLVWGHPFAPPLPELEWRWGYPLILLVMLAIAVFMLAAFKRKKWL